MDREDLRRVWLREQALAHIHGWDFSHLRGRYEVEKDLPWSYEQLVRQYLDPSLELLDYDTGGGEFLLSLRHPYSKTSATEGWPPNVRLCGERLPPLGIRFRECRDPARIPFDDGSFDVILNRHGAFHPGELFRLLRPKGLFITEQVGEDNDRDLVERVLPGTEKPFPHMNLSEQRRNFEDAGFSILRAEEAFRPILFYDVGAFVWFARVIQWEFPGFSVEGCFDRLLQLQETLDQTGRIEGTIHRYLIVAGKPG